MIRRLAGLTLAVVAALALTGCGTNPAGHDDRLVKAAGIKTLKIKCHKDVWAQVKDNPYTGDSEIDAKVEKGPNDTVTVELSGPDLVTLLEWLAASSNGTGFADPTDDPVAERLYKALAPVVDSTKTQQAAGDPVPEVVLDDAATGNTVPSSSPSAVPNP